MKRNPIIEAILLDDKSNLKKFISYGVDADRVKCTDKYCGGCLAFTTKAFLDKYIDNSKHGVSCVGRYNYIIDYVNEFLPEVMLDIFTELL